MLISGYIILASCLFLLAHALRALRLYFILGHWRVPFCDVFFAHLLALAIAHTLFTLSYEVSILVFLALYNIKYVVPACYSMLIFRIIDVVAVLAFMFAAGTMHTHLVFLMIILFFILWLAIVAFDPLLSRIRKKILAYPRAFFMDKSMLCFLTEVHTAIKGLAWNRQASFSIVVILSACSWLLEWAALSLALNSMSDGVTAIITRVGRSLNFLPYNSAIPSYGTFMVVTYIVIPLVGAWSLYKRYRVSA